MGKLRSTAAHTGLGVLGCVLVLATLGVSVAVWLLLAYLIVYLATEMGYELSYWTIVGCVAILSLLLGGR